MLTPKAFHQITGSLRDGFILLSAGGSIEAANKAAQELVHRESLQGLPFEALVTDPPEKVAAALTLWSSSRELLPAVFEVRHENKTTVIRCDGALIQPARNGTSALLLLHCTARSPSAAAAVFDKLNQRIAALEKHLAQQQDREQQRMADMQTAAAIFAHEISNPLNFISTSLQLLDIELAHRKLVDPVLNSTIEAASREIQRLSSLLREFRSFAQPQNLDLRPADLMRVIRDALASQMAVFRAAGIHVEVDFALLPPVLIDEDKMKQVILNLCKNAVEAMPEGGQLTLKSYPEDHAAVLEISDTGIGTPKDIDIFGLFRTTKQHGSGLGLSIVGQIMSAQKGTVDCTSEPGKGTTFRLTLPIRF